MMKGICRTRKELQNIRDMHDKIMYFARYEFKKAMEERDKRIKNYLLYGTTHPEFSNIDPIDPPEGYMLNPLAKDGESPREKIIQ